MALFLCPAGECLEHLGLFVRDDRSLGLWLCPHRFGCESEQVEVCRGDDGATTTFIGRRECSRENTRRPRVHCSESPLEVEALIPILPDPLRFMVETALMPVGYWRVWATRLPRDETPLFTSQLRPTLLNWATLTNLGVTPLDLVLRLPTPDALHVLVLHSGGEIVLNILTAFLYCISTATRTSRKIYLPRIRFSRLRVLLPAFAPR